MPEQNPPLTNAEQFAALFRSALPERDLSALLTPAEDTNTTEETTE